MGVLDAFKTLSIPEMVRGMDAGAGALHGLANAFQHECLCVCGALRPLIGA